MMYNVQVEFSHVSSFINPQLFVLNLMLTHDYSRVGQPKSLNAYPTSSEVAILDYQMVDAHNQVIGVLMHSEKLCNISCISLNVSENTENTGRLWLGGWHIDLKSKLYIIIYIYMYLFRWMMG